MCTPPRAGVLTVADIFRQHGEAYCQQHALSYSQWRAMRAIEQCRTGALGGHLERCDTCGAIIPRMHSCRNRHCGQCQTLDKERWLERQRAELLDTPYFHVVFTLPHALNPLAQGNPRLIYDLLFRAASETLLDFGRNPRWLGGELGITMILHTWGQNLGQHIHVHCVVTGGALSADGRWLAAKKGFLFPVRALSAVFRAKYLDYLQQASHRGQLQFAGSVAALTDTTAFEGFVAQLKAHDWVVYAKPPLAGPQQAIDYLGRYTHRVAIANHRLVELANGYVRFRWRDYAHGNKVKVMQLTAEEFIRRFLLHILPSGYQKIRHFGVLANRCKHIKLAACRRALGQAPLQPVVRLGVAELMQRLTGIDIRRCPHCALGHLRIIVTFQAVVWPQEAPLPYPTGPP